MKKLFVFAVAFIAFTYFAFSEKKKMVDKENTAYVKASTKTTSAPTIRQ